MSRKFEFRYHLTRITGTVHEGHLNFDITSRSILLRMSNVSDSSAHRNLKPRNFCWLEFHSNQQTRHHPYRVTNTSVA